MTSPESPAVPFTSGTWSTSTEDIGSAPENARSPTLREPEAVLPSSPTIPLRRQASQHPSPITVDVESPVEPPPEVPTAPPANIAQSKDRPTTSRRNETRNRVSLAALTLGQSLPAASVHETSGVAASDGVVLASRGESGPSKATNRQGTGAAAGRTEPSPAEPRGRFSWHHACLLACAQLSLGVLTFHWLATPLLAMPVDHWCRQPPEMRNASADEWKKSAIPLRSDGRYSQCTMYREFSRHSPGASDIEAPRHVEGALQVTDRRLEETDCLDWDYDLKPGIKTMASEWNLVCGRARLLSVSAAYNSIGGVVATPLVGQMADRLGRR